MRGFKIIQIRKWILAIIMTVVAVTAFACGRIRVSAAVVTAVDMGRYDGVTVSSDGTAWTTDYLDRTNERLDKGYTITTGLTSSLRELEVGEHYYSVASNGEVHIGKWVVTWPNAQCIHAFGAMEYKGFQVKEGICENYYNNGWYAYCADCGELVADMHIYAQSKTIGQITSIPAESTYLYICPHCQGLEQGTEYQHMCKDISYNFYRVVYEKNAPAGVEVTGYMAETRHMYNNAAVYEGVSAHKLGFGDTRLRKNSFTCKGYVFKGWNTMADGSGEHFTDAQSVLNLTQEEGGTVKLFAQWQLAESSLIIDADGGTYSGEAVFTVTQTYGSTYEVDESLLIPPKGHTVRFETNGGSAVTDICTFRSLSHWEVQGVLSGTFRANIYTFLAESGQTDRIKACYVDDTFILPECKKENESLTGWFSDASCTKESFLGRPGEQISVSEDCVIYAGWAGLTLWAEDNYEAYGGAGAVDLSWEQKDGQSKYYKLYQSLDESNWKGIFAGSTVLEKKEVSEAFDVLRQGEQLVIKENGYYRLSAAGAKGADYSEELPGGAGGSVEAEYWLLKGDRLTFYAGSSGKGLEGGTNGHEASGGDSISEAGRGGGAATAVFLTRDGVCEPLLIAGGGGGANEAFAGGAGGVFFTEPQSMKGEDSEYGGGGGGASGGKSSAAYSSSTLEKPDIADVAFRSLFTMYTPPATQVYGQWKGGRENNTAYPILNITDAQWNEYSGSVSVGELARPLAITSSGEMEHNNEEEWHYNDDIRYMPEVNAPPAWNCIQSNGGFIRNFSAVYPTNGNTNVVVSGLIDSWSGSIEGEIRFQISDADTGRILHDVMYVDGACYAPYADAADWDIMAWGDFDVSGSENVQIKVCIFQFCDAAHTVSKVMDTFFYGKKVWSGSEAEGGSSYINTGYGCRNQAGASGVNKEDGFAEIYGIDIGYNEETRLDKVPARDMAAPEAVVSYKITMSDAKQLSVYLKEPVDLGTNYYHMAESYRVNESDVERIAVSNITINTLTSGVKGYHFYVDEQKTGVVTTGHAFHEKEKIPVDMTANVMYLHVAAVDVAGNLGPVTDILLEMSDELDTDESYPDKISLFTEALQIAESDFIYQAEESVYYVKADGVTEHLMISEGYMNGAATKDFQIDRMGLYMENDNTQAWFKSGIPKGSILESSQDFGNDSLEMEAEGELAAFIKAGAASALRRDYAVRVCLESQFYVENGTLPFMIYPGAEAEFGEKLYCSEEESDRANGLYIIPDGEAPEISGLEELYELDVLDMTESTKEYVLTAQDTLSGLQEFTVYVSNQDNFMKKEFPCDAYGKTVIVIDKSNPLFVGEIAISAVAVDRVGNASVIGEDGLTFTLDTSLYRERNPSENVFKTGDGAVLEIETRGYVERVEVIFPEELLAANSELNRVFEYELPYLRKKEMLHFSIPLGIREKQYEITVKAYKNGRVLISKPEMIIVEGNVLDELRTRIRNNG